MDCEKANELIPLYLDQALDDAETNKLRVHLLKCKACKQELIEMEEIVSKLQTMPKHELPLGYHEELMDKIRASITVQTKKKGMAPWMGVGVAAAVIAVAVYAGGGLDTMLQNRNSSTENGKGQEEIAAAAPNDTMRSLADAEGAAPVVSTEIFENMDEVDVMDTAEADAATGSLPESLEGNVVSAVVPSDEEFIIIDDLSLVEPIIVADAEHIIVAAPPQEVMPPIIQTEPTQSVLLSDISKTRSVTLENEVVDSQLLPEVKENAVVAEPAISLGDVEVDWETIPEEDPHVTENVMAKPLTESPKLLEKQSNAIPQPTESAIGLKNSAIVSISISASNMQDFFQMVSDYIFAQGGMMLHEVLPEGLADANTPVIPENRMLFKIPKAVYETTIAELSKFNILDYAEWEAPMDTIYEVLKQERNILEKNGYHDLEAQLAEYDRKIATWENEEDYTTVYLTVLENKLAEK